MTLRPADLTPQQAQAIINTIIGGTLNARLQEARAQAALEDTRRREPEDPQ